jgi:hypothetical protein
MKKMFVLLVAVCVATTSVIAAQPATPVSEKAKTTFASTFKEAANVQWTSTEGLYLVQFEVNNEPIMAWISEEGELEAVQRTVDINRVSFMVAQAIQDLSKDVTVNTIAEVNQYGELYYLVKAETEKHLVTYKILTNGAVTKLSRKKKQ